MLTFDEVNDFTVKEWWKYGEILSDFNRYPEYYNNYLTTYAPKASGRYDTHKKSELRGVSAAYARSGHKRKRRQSDVLLGRLPA